MIEDCHIMNREIGKGLRDFDRSIQVDESFIDSYIKEQRFTSIKKNTMKQFMTLMR